MAATGGASYGIITNWDFNSGETLVLERKQGAGAYAVIASLKGGTQDYTDVLPNDGLTYTYQAKVTKTGYADSSYSGTVSGTPQDLSVL